MIEMGSDTIEVMVRSADTGDSYTYRCASWSSDGSVIKMVRPLLVEIRHRNGMASHPAAPRFLPPIGMVNLGPGWYACEVGRDGGKPPAQLVTAAPDGAVMTVALHGTDRDGNHAATQWHLPPPTGMVQLRLIEVTHGPVMLGRIDLRPPVN